MSEYTAVYPGTFDPITNGHSDIIVRAARIFPKLIVAVAKISGPKKKPLFTFEERIDMAKEIFKEYDNIEVVGFDNLLVRFMDTINSRVLVRGLRAVSDFEYEFQMASLNRHLNANIETIFLTPSEKYSFVSSTMVREASMLGGDISAIVHPYVKEALERKYQERLLAES
ncbi:pantetheine-phosphate adenylyltransferase [Ignatzschineria ureiclastica]|uniref:Phosphopantetheine adenylyltransferase n=1 Tax=Ignatzschineria ureiclastica TaxID=472582 RepID=A0A2U2AHA3_9GAMM|nr:pantetheine-phosphate adenylyltransferase [Ignatzschineria ureiclastica]PWD82036.1 pantetheine-phosphate adenylyltransferase [Ignatzschineria ureiclastica]GGZ92206.1 phosphopantetheine adenylyltransferase [Ignatzschineria ureiclastica]